MAYTAFHLLFIQPVWSVLSKDTAVAHKWQRKRQAIIETTYGMYQTFGQKRTLWNYNNNGIYSTFVHKEPSGTTIILWQWEGQQWAGHATLMPLKHVVPWATVNTNSEIPHVASSEPQDADF